MATATSVRRLQAQVCHRHVLASNYFVAYITGGCDNAGYIGVQSNILSIMGARLAMERTN